VSDDIVARLVRWHTAMADEPKRAESKRTKHRETADLIERQAEELAALRERADKAKAEGIKEGLRRAAEICRARAVKLAPENTDHTEDGCYDCGAEDEADYLAIAILEEIGE
jgi:hypothetical protein